MAVTVHCDIVSAEEAIFNGPVELLVCEGEVGAMGIAPGHAPLLTRLVPGPLRVINEYGKESVIYVDGGFVEVQPDLITVLADTAIRAADLDEAAAEAAKEAAQKEMAEKFASKEYAEVATKLSRAVAQLRTIRVARKALK